MQDVRAEGREESENIGWGSNKNQIEDWVQEARNF